MNICPTCEGKGKLSGYACPGFRLVELGCVTCYGQKEISDEHLQQIEKGKAMRQERIKRGVSLREEAKRLGLSPSDYSAVEQGRKHL